MDNGYQPVQGGEKSQDSDHRRQKDWSIYIISAPDSAKGTAWKAKKICMRHTKQGGFGIF